MKKVLVLGLTISIILLGGCGVETNEVKKAQAEQEQNRPKDMDPKDLPQVTAFQDEKTREFMVSINEEEPGYYLLEGKTKKFRMLFPENGKYQARRSSFMSENEESIGFSSYNKETNILVDIKINYYNGTGLVEDVDTMLEIISGKNGYQGDFSKDNIGGTEIYSASKKNIFDEIESENNFTYGYFGLVKPLGKVDEGIEFGSMITCQEDDRECQLDESTAIDGVDKLIQSIQFINK
jgi:hypothetical protein